MAKYSDRQLIVMGVIVIAGAWWALARVEGGIDKAVSGVKDMFSLKFIGDGANIKGVLRTAYRYWLGVLGIKKNTLVSDCDPDGTYVGAWICEGETSGFRTGGGF